MIAFAATTSSTAYWYLTRGAGAVSLVLLTLVVVLGLAGTMRWGLAPRLPRFAVDALHRDLSLLALALLVVHILTSVLDGFAPISLLDAVIPFASPYRPLWLGFGALALDLLLAIIATSLVRRRLGYRSWRAVHWLAYLSWPVAVVHGLGTGSDTRQWWMLALTAVCVLAVLAVLLARVIRLPPAEHRVPLGGAAVATVLALGLFTIVGPLRPGWARRAGTPTTLLARASPPGAAGATSPGRRPATLAIPFHAALVGTVSQHQAAGGTIIDLSLRLRGQARGRLRMRLAGAALPQGGLSLTGSQVDLLADGLNGVFSGKISALQGQEILARVAGASGRALQLRADLNLDGATRQATGTLAVTGSAGSS